MSTNISDIPRAASPSQEDIDNYRVIWNYYVWDYSANDTYGAMVESGYEVTRDYVREAVAKMREILDNESYETLAESEIRKYLARNSLFEQELIEQYIQAKNDMALLRTGKARYDDGRKAMPVDLKTLMNLASSIDKFGQARISLLAKLGFSDGSSGGGGNRLSDGEKAALMDSLSRTPEEPEDVDGDVIDVESRPAD